MTDPLADTVADTLADTVPDALADAVRRAARGLGLEPPGAVALVPATTGPGWSCAAARRWATALGAEPAELAEQLADVLRARPDVASASGTADGMLHVVLTPAAAGAVVPLVLADGSCDRGWPVTPGPAPALPGPGERRRGHPVFDVVWAHSRARVAVAGVGWPDAAVSTEVGDLLTDAREDALLTALAAFPAAVERAADRAALLRRATELAARTHAWLDEDDVLPRTHDDPVEPVHLARRALAAAAATVLAAALDQLGLPAPTPV